MAAGSRDVEHTPSDADRAGPLTDRTEERHGSDEDPISQHLAESIAFSKYMLSAWVDGLRVRLRHGVVAIGLVIAAIPVVLIATGLALHMVMQALAAAVVEWTAWPVWAGELLVGAAVLAAVFGATGFAIHRVQAQSRRRTMREYEQEREEQRNTYGADAHEQAAA